MRIAIISAFFEEHVRYQEVQLADTFARLGHHVTVITTDRSYHDRDQRRTSGGNGYRILRVSRIVRLRNSFFPVGGVRNAVQIANPEIAILIHPGSGFPYYVLNRLPPSCRVVSVFGDLWLEKSLGMHKLKPNRAIQFLLKNAWYRRVFERSCTIVANTNATVDILLSVAHSDISRKLIMPGLGFDPTVFQEAPQVRRLERESLGARSDQIVISTITRIQPEKPIQTWLKPVLRAMVSNTRIVYVLAGFDQGQYSAEVRKALIGSPVSDRLRLLDYLNANDINRLFNASDYSLWFLPSITIQQSMASGTPVILPRVNTVDHLVDNGVNGQVYDSPEGLESMITDLREWPVARTEVARWNDRFSYDNIVRKILDHAMKVA